jgi:hypothetical protein
MSTTTPHASRAFSCPIHPAAVSAASPSSFKPKPYTTNETIAARAPSSSSSVARSSSSRTDRDARVEETIESINQSKNPILSFIHSILPRRLRLARLTLMCVCAAMRALRARLGTSSIFIRSIVAG